MQSEQLVIFQLATEEYALPISQVKEIIYYTVPTKIPNAPSYIEGVINLRDKIIPVVDIGKKLHITIQPLEEKQTLIVEINKLTIGLVVNGVKEVVHFENFAAEDIKEIDSKNQTIKSVLKKDKRMIILLNLQQIFSENN